MAAEYSLLFHPCLEELILSTWRQGWLSLERQVGLEVVLFVGLVLQEQ